MGSFVLSHTTGTSASGTSVTATLAANVVPMNLLVVWVAMDNTGTATPTVSAIDKPAGETASWAQIASHNSSTATSGGGVRGEMWAIRTTQQWNSGTVITATLSASPPKSHMLCQEHNGVFATLRGTAGTGTSATGAPSAATSGTALVSGDLVIGGATFETSTTPTADSDTTNGSWAQTLTGNTGGGATAAQVSSIMQHKYVTATGVQTYNPTANSTDSGAAVVGLQRDPTQYVAVGKVSGTDIAQALVRVKSLTTGQPTDTDVSQAITRVRSRVLGQATEDNISQPITLGAVADANAAPTVRIERVASDGTPISTIVSETSNQGAGEFVTTDGGGAISLTIPAGSVTDTTLDPGDRLRVTLWIDDAGDQGGTGNMVASQSVQFYINGPAGAQGQSRITFSEALTQFDAGGAIPTGKATETDTAQPLARNKKKIVSINDPDQYADEFHPPITETNIARPIARLKTKAISQAVETNTSQIIARPGQVNRATETDIAQAIIRVKLRTISQTAETDVPNVIVEHKSRLIGQSVETNISNAIARNKRKLFVQALETDSATNLTRPGRINQVVETDIAQPITRIKRKTLGQPTETSAPQALVRLKSRLFAQAQESDTAQRILRPGRINQIVETDTAQPITPAKRKVIAQALETSLANAFVKRKTKTLAQPTEADFARPIITYARVNNVIETDTAQPITRIKRKTLGLATEANVVFSFTRIHSRNLGQPIETDVVFALSPKKNRLLGRAIEIDIATAMDFGGLGSQLVMVAAYPSYASVAGYHTGLVGYVLEHEFLAAASELAEV